MTMNVFGDLDIHLSSTLPVELINRMALESGSHWHRNQELEDRVNRSDSPMYCFTFDDTSDTELPSANLWLAVRDNHAYVPNIVPAKKAELTTHEYNQLLNNFNEEIVTPAAKQLGLQTEISKTDIELEDIVSAETARRLKSFSRSMNKSTGPTHPLDKRRWFNFIISHHCKQEDMPIDILEAWLISDGWSEDKAWELAVEFETATQLLRQYDGKED